MRRFQIPNAALVAGLAVLLSGCSGETPTAPSSNGNPNGSGGSCTVLVSLSAPTQSPFVGTAALVRATVTRSGVPVPDGGSVQYTTDLGVFLDNGLNTISKTIVGGVADVFVSSSNSGTAHVKAVFDCANAQINLNFGGVPDTGPFISSLSPTTGSCAGGDTVTILGGRFGTGAVDVFFGSVKGSIKGAVTNTQLTVTTPAHAEGSVNVVVVVNGSTSPPFQFTFTCIPPALKVFLSSINPTAGSPAGGDTVQILGGHFGTNIATTKVTFCGAPAQIVTQTDVQITVTTPVHALANPAISETCDVSVRRDIGLVSENFATLAQAFTYRGNGSGTTCNTDPAFFIASLTPNSGPPDGGTTVTLTGSGFGSTASLMRVDFGGTPATIVGISNNTTIVVSTPRHTLASPDVPETVDVTVTDLGSPVQRCARVVSGFVYTAKALDPTIYSVSPRTGPNDASTRVSIFGTGFQFPMQVFLTGGACGAQLVEAAVSDISLNTIVFKTPVAVGGNVCLANQLVDIVIKNPSTGKGTSCPACFKYYACPTITSAGPTFTNYNVTTQVVITGHNFEEPATVSGGGTVWQPISVSSEQIIAIAPLALLTGACADISSPILVNGTSLSCPNAVGPIFTYWVKTVSPVVTKIDPRELQQASTFPVLVTVTGDHFFAPNMRFILTMPAGGPITIFPESRTDTVMTFKAPALIGPYLTASCKTPAGDSGTQSLPTPVELDVVNNTTTCFAKEQLVYVPTDQSCRVPVTPPTAVKIETTTLPDGTNGTAYNFTLVATGGTPGYTWAVTSGALPTVLALNGATGTISGTLTPAVVGTFNFAIKVTDSVGGTATAAVSITVN